MTGDTLATLRRPFDDVLATFRRRSGAPESRAERAFCLRVAVGEALGHTKRSLEIATDLGDRAGVARKLGNLGQIYVEVGDLAKAEGILGRGLKLAEALGDTTTLVDATITLGQAYLKAQKKEARRLFRRGLELAVAAGARYHEVRARVYLAQALLKLGGPPDEALALAEQAAARAREAKMATGETFALITQGMALAGLGRAREACDRAAAAVALLDKIPDPEGADEVHYTHARLAASAGRAREAVRALARARMDVERKVRKLGDPGLRTRYLSSSPARDILAGTI